MDSSMCSSAPDPEMWIIQGTLAWRYFSCSNRGFETKTSPQEDRWGDSGEIQCRSNFLFTRGSGRSRGGTTTAPLFSRIHTSLISIWTAISRAQDGIALKLRARFKRGKALRWIPRHPETRKGVVSDEMLRGVENKRRIRRFPNRSTFRTAAESMGRQETTWRTETS
ncbi:Ycf68 protein [Quillaja saponaria]|uniref:Uncharacterized protein ycf68 n=1 Tax=Quillaja saponaria TaxID=32244 RepID=A0AAD7KKV5_QUISA|nr:Ycf68 protein [Quillaja saponaria]